MPTVTTATTKDIVIKQVTITLTNDEIISAPNTPPVLIPKAGENTIICVIRSMYAFIPVAPYENLDAGAFINLTYEGIIDATNYVLGSQILSSATPKISFGTPVSYIGSGDLVGSLIEMTNDTPNVTNKDVVVSIYNNDINFTGGDPANYLKVTATYFILNLDLT